MAEEKKIRRGSDLLQCPGCKTQLVPHPMDEGLTAMRCPDCDGNWIDSKVYWQWIESRPKTEMPENTPDAPAASVLPVRDIGPGKFCPGCGRFLARAKPGHGLDFYLNRCGGCGSIWLDANEWQNLRALGLHDDIHFIFSDAWQAEVAKVERNKNYELILVERIGPEALEEIKRIKTWLDHHPKRAELYAYLVGPKENPPSKR